MTKPVMDLRALVEKSAEADLLREMIGFAAARLMELELGARTGADYGEKSSDRLAQRNGYRARDWQTRAGSVELRIPRLRTGSYVPSFREPRRSVEKALTAVIQEACVHGVSPRAMDDLVQAMGGTGIPKSQASRLCEEIDDPCRCLPDPPDRGRVAIPVDRCDLPEATPRRAHRQCRGHDRRGRQHGWPPRGSKHGDRRLGS